MPAMRVGRYRSSVRIRLDLLQGAVALQELPRTVRLISSVTRRVARMRPSVNCEAIHLLRKESMDCVVASLLAMTTRDRDVPRAPFSSPGRRRYTPQIRRRHIDDVCDPKELAEDYRFAPGQYLTLRTMLDGEEVRRSYSICSGPDDGELRIAVKRVDGGAFSSWASEELKHGDALDVMTPTGRFGVNPRRTKRDICRFCRGLRDHANPVDLEGHTGARAAQPLFLFYGCRSTVGMLFREALEELKDRYMERLSLFHVISGEEQDVPILHGRLDGEKVRVLLRSLVPVTSIDHVFICGPTGMSEEIEATCRALGVAEDRIHIERFVSGLGGKPRPRAVVPSSAPPKAIAALIIDGKRREVPVAEGEAVLDAALRAGLDLPLRARAACVPPAAPSWSKAMRRWRRTTRSSRGS